jgi:hypothetical protein
MDEVSMGDACGMHGKMRSGYRVLVVNPTRKRSFGDIGVGVNNNPKGEPKRSENTCRIHAQTLKMHK